VSEQPLFRVFSWGERWAVCGVNLEGEPTAIEGTYRSLKQAMVQAARANEIFAKQL
jgi:hypothetical protein